MPDSPDRDTTTPFVYKALGGLEVKADRAAADIETIRTAIAEIPTRVESIVKASITPLVTTVGEVRADLNEVQTVVNRWKAILAVAMGLSLLAGWLVSNFVTLKKLLVGS
jgi:glucosamine 6-phosphate synthetase-like amidotransferase/phosphosugar isomerase protein